jgi:hypothetical protein
MLPSPPVIGQQKTYLYNRSKFEFIKDFDLDGVVGNFTAQLVVTCQKERYHNRLKINRYIAVTTKLSFGDMVLRYLKKK